MWVVVVGLLVRERRQRFRSLARILRPVPCVIDRLTEILHDLLALLGHSVGVGVLMAHHDDTFTVHAELDAESRVASLDVVNLAIEFVHSISVFSDHISVVGNLKVVSVNVLIILAALLPCVVDAILEPGNRLTKGFSSNKHVSGLGNLELISVLAEESSISVKSIDSLMKIRGGRVGRRSCLVAAVVLVIRIVVVEMLIKIRSVFTISVVILGLAGEGNGGQKSSCDFHCLHLRLKFIDEIFTRSL